MQARREKSIVQLRLRARQDSARSAAARGTESEIELRDLVRLLPDQRGRQARTYPTALPDQPRVYFTWSEAEPDPQTVDVLDALLARVSRLGHSSSHVACRVVETAAPASWRPAEDGEQHLRVPRTGLLRQLERDFARHQGVEPRALPASVARYTSARAATAVPVSQLSDAWLVLSLSARGSGGRPLLVQHSLAVCRAVRDAILAHSTEPVPEVLSGHLPGAQGEQTPPSRQPHLAVAPMADVGHGHASGRLLGIGLALPRNVAAPDRKSLLVALGTWRRAGFALRLGALGVHALELADDQETRVGLQPATWTRPSWAWLSVTPVVLDRHPRVVRGKRLFDDPVAVEQATAIVARSCEHIGLPRPAQVELLTSPPLRGVPPLRRFPPYTNGRGPTRISAHVALRFDEPVHGPVLLGAGRYTGYGLLRPWSPA